MYLTLKNNFILKFYRFNLRGSFKNWFQSLILRRTINRYGNRRFMCKSMPINHKIEIEFVININIFNL